MSEIENKLSALALTFPTLKRALGVAPFVPTHLESWACGPEPSSGGIHAARFVLHVWNTNAKWRCGRFDVFAALNCWDPAHVAAFAAWVAKPWTA